MDFNCCVYEIIASLYAYDHNVCVYYSLQSLDDMSCEETPP